MIEPIGLVDSLASPYERYIQYQQFAKQDSPQNKSVLSSLEPEQPAPSGQALPPEQFVAQAQPDQAPQQAGTGVQKEPPRKAGASQSSLAAGDRECQTCKNRKYQDQSDDPGVSYQTPTKISPGQVASAVRSHEYEHVSREQSKAARQNREVVSQSVILKSSICPECGKVYISGGETRTVSKAKGKETVFQAGQANEADGLYFDKNV
ncbi:MAG: hypothetical protein LBH09_00985 [Peptococcaceae bacterium]|jgi:hypothetical protein|nr:hypothetical protein [Peptococcaceae bacterium]